MNGGVDRRSWGPSRAHRAVQADRAHLAAFRRHPGGSAPADPVAADQHRRPPPAEALARLFELPGSHYSDPEFSWKFATPPAAIGFLGSRVLGPQYQNDLFAGAATPLTAGGYLFRFNLTGNRRQIGVDDPRLEDRVADNKCEARHHGEREPALRGRTSGSARTSRPGRTATCTSSRSRTAPCIGSHGGNSSDPQKAALRPPFAV